MPLFELVDSFNIRIAFISEDSAASTDATTNHCVTSLWSPSGGHLTQG